MFPLILIIGIISSQKDLFAGNGLVVDVNNGGFELNCTTYDDCYSLLCSLILFPTDYIINLKPNKWNGNCKKLKNDTRSMAALYDVYYNRKLIMEYAENTVSEASILLCSLKNYTRIQYWGIPCNIGNFI